MLTPETYTETIQFRVWGKGTARERRALIPSELDVALLNHQLSNFRDELERLETQAPPPAIAALKAKRAALDAERDPKKRKDLPPITESEQAELASWESMRHGEYAGWQAAIHRTERSLSQALAVMDAPDDPESEVVSRTFTMREFTYEERLEAEDRHSTKIPGGRVEVDIAKRNLELLNRCVLSEQAEGQVIAVKDNAGKLPSKIAATLSDRLWARAEMSHDLAAHFRDRRQDPGN